VRKLAFKYAQACRIKKPASWETNQCAGEDWFTFFMKRHKKISLRTPEGTSLARMINFNKTNVNEFFQNLSSVLQRNSYHAGSIWNADETGLTTVQKPQRVVARKGFKQIGRATSGERGQLVTMAIAVSAGGNSIPPFFVFPRVNYKEHFVKDGPPNSSGDANPSGWMTDVTFAKFAKHFVKHAAPSASNPTLLIYDNHQSHLNAATLEYFKEQHVTIVSLPPHCSHKLQPLDCSVFGPLKKYYNSAADAWMSENPGKSMKIYDIPGLLTKALPMACTSSNIYSGFKKTGVWPFKPDIFKEEDFMPTYSVDRPLEASEPEERLEVMKHFMDLPSTSAFAVNSEPCFLSEISSQSSPNESEQPSTSQANKRLRKTCSNALIKPEQSVQASLSPQPYKPAMKTEPSSPPPSPKHLNKTRSHALVKPKQSVSLQTSSSPPPNLQKKRSHAMAKPKKLPAIKLEPSSLPPPLKKAKTTRSSALVKSTQPVPLPLSSTPPLSPPIAGEPVIKTEMSLQSPLKSPQLERLFPLPKAPSRAEATTRGRKKRKSAVLTDSPVRKALAAEQMKSNKKKIKVEPKRKGRSTQKKT